MATKKSSKPSPKKGYTTHKHILVVNEPSNGFSSEAKDFINDVNNITRTCPFCGKKPNKDVFEMGISDDEIKKIKDEEDFQLDSDYRKIMLDYIKTNGHKAEFRISCINKECLQPTTGFLQTAEEAEQKWNTRN